MSGGGVIDGILARIVKRARCALALAVLARGSRNAAGKRKDKAEDDAAKGAARKARRKRAWRRFRPRFGVRG